MPIPEIAKLKLFRSVLKTVNRSDETKQETSDISRKAIIAPSV